MSLENYEPELSLPTPVQRIALPNVPKATEVYLKRDDLIHPLVSGNKWRKLKGYLAEAQRNNQGIWTCGGAFSNHLIATAVACNKLEIPCGAYVRGEELSAESNPVLQSCADHNMQLNFVSRTRYKTIKTAPNSNYLFVPEGGYGILAAEGLKAGLAEIEGTYDYLICGVGSGTTLGGLSTANKKLTVAKKVVVIAALKQADYLKDEIAKIWPEAAFELKTQFAGKGFGKITWEIVDYTEQFYQRNQILLDPLYTAKMCLGIEHLLLQGEMPLQSKILLWHTGGLSGWWGAKSIPYGIKKALQQLNLQF